MAPSANLSGSETGIIVEKVISELGEEIDYLIDSGDVNNDTTSTIVRIKDEKVLILREGKISKEEISKIVPIKN